MTFGIMETGPDVPNVNNINGNKNADIGQTVNHVPSIVTNIDVLKISMVTKHIFTRPLGNKTMTQIMFQDIFFRKNCICLFF